MSKKRKNTKSTQTCVFDFKMVRNFGLDELNILNYYPLIEEIWILIFKYLNEFERRNIEMICKSFYIIIRSKPHFISNEIKSFYEFFGSMKKFKNYNLSGITKLSMRNCDPKLINEIGLCFINIKKLVIRSVHKSYCYKSFLSDNLSKELNLWINLNRGDLFKYLKEVLIANSNNIICDYFKMCYLKVKLEFSDSTHCIICFECDSFGFKYRNNYKDIMIKCKYCPKFFCSKCVENKNVLKRIYSPSRSLTKGNYIDICYFCFTGLRKCIDCNNLIYNFRNSSCKPCLNKKSKNKQMGIIKDDIDNIDNIDDIDCIDYGDY
jgi:hypothetical protein